MAKITKGKDPIKALNKANRHRILTDICDLIDNEKSKRGKGKKKLPNGFVKQIVDSMSKDNPWLTRNVINHFNADRKNLNQL